MLKSLIDRAGLLFPLLPVPVVKDVGVVVHVGPVHRHEQGGEAARVTPGGGCCMPFASNSFSRANQHDCLSQSVPAQLHFDLPRVLKSGIARRLLNLAL